MPIRKPEDSRRSIRVGGEESVVDVARVVFKDPRLAALIADLNPALPLRGAIQAGAVVTVPSVQEARAFAKQMGFTLGFNEAGTNGTRRKRAWAKLKGPGAASRGGIDPADAARKLLADGLPAAEVGKRLSQLCTPESLERFLAAPVDPALAVVSQSVELFVRFPKAHARLTQLIGLLEASTRPSGALALIEAVARDAPGADRVLRAVVAPDAERAALLESAPRVVALLERARRLAGLERGERDLELAGDAQAALLAPLVAAVVDRVELLSGERLKLLGVEGAWSVLRAHLERLKELCRKQDAQLGRAGSAVVRALAHGTEAPSLPRPWPLLAALVHGLGPALDAAGPSALHAGLGALVRKSPSAVPANAVRPGPHEGAPLATGEGAPVLSGGALSAASLQARAATGARSVDEGTAIAERLAPRLAALIELSHPLAGDTGPAPLRRARRRAHFDALVLARSAPQGTAVARHLEELLGDARRGKVGGADTLERAQLVGAREVALLLTGSLTLRQQNVSELARALVVAVMTLDRELGARLARPTGREAFRDAVDKHATRLLSRAALSYSEPPSAR